MICAGCRRELEIGDHYIIGTVGEILKEDVDPGMSSIIADILGAHDALDGSAGGKIIFCEDCTTEGGDFLLDTYYGDEDDEEDDEEDE